MASSSAHGVEVDLLHEGHVIDFPKKDTLCQTPREPSMQLSSACIVHGIEEIS